MRGHGHSPSQEPLAWERVQWRQGDGRYSFEVAQGGLFATLTSPHGGTLTMPLVAWEGLLDALAAARKTRTRGERGMPSRANARWSEEESGELVAAFQQGRTISQLAQAHNRTAFAIESQLDRLGLWDRTTRQPTGQPRVDADLPPWSFAGNGPVGARRIPRAEEPDAQPPPPIHFPGQRD